MRARDVIVAGLVAIFPAACADGPGTTLQDTDPNFAEELELALFSAAEGSTDAVISAIEMAQPAGDGESPRVTAVEGDHPVPESAPSIDLLGVPVATLALAGMPAAAPAAPTDGMAGPVAIPERASAGRGDEDGGVDWGGVLGTIGTVIIRGGVVSGRDPCALHVPGRGVVAGRGGGIGAVGVLINDRSPRVGPQRGDDGRSAVPRRGAVLPGGIR